MTAFGTDVAKGTAVGPVYIKKSCCFGIQLCTSLVEFIVATNPALYAIAVNDHLFGYYFIFWKEGHKVQLYVINLIVINSLKTSLPAHRL